MKRYFLLIVHGDVEPEIKPFPSDVARDEYAKLHRYKDPNFEDGLYPLEVDTPASVHPKVSIDSYSGLFFDDVPEKEDEELYYNYYKCECREEWQGYWSCACNDKCPSCNAEVEPHRSRTKCESCDGGGYVGEAGHEQECDNCHHEGYVD